MLGKPDKLLVSLEKQSVSYFKIIIIDDGSTDNTLNILNKFASSSIRDISIYSINHSGVVDARNHALELLETEYFCFVDSDDTVASNMLELLYNKAYNDSADIVTCGLRYVYKYHYVDDIPTQQMIDQNKYASNFRHPGGILYKSDIWRNNNIKFEKSSNSVRLLPHNPIVFSLTNKIYAVEEILYFYNQTPKCTLNNQEPVYWHKDRYIEALDYLIQHYKKFNLSDQKYTNYLSTLFYSLLVLETNPIKLRHYIGQYYKFVSCGILDSRRNKILKACCHYFPAYIAILLIIIYKKFIPEVRIIHSRLKAEIYNKVGEFQKIRYDKSLVTYILN